MPTWSFLQWSTGHHVVFVISAVWGHWLEMVQRRRHLGRLLARCVARRSQTLLATALAEWRHAAEQRRALREHLIAMGNHADAALLKSAFTAWLDAHAAKQQQQVILNLPHALPKWFILEVCALHPIASPKIFSLPKLVSYEVQIKPLRQKINVDKHAGKCSPCSRRTPSVGQ